MPEILIVPPEEQKIRKKAEEKPIIKPQYPKSKELRMKETHRMIIPEKERIPGVPVIPTDPCCSKVCETLNNDIDSIKMSMDIYTKFSGAGARESKVYRNLLYRVYALEDHRQGLKEKNSCRCIENTGAVSIMLPLLQAPILEEKGRGIPIKGPMFKLHPLDKIREFHIKERSIVPPGNACCPDNCRILNKDIDETNKILDLMELRGGPGALKSPRFEALTYKALALQDYRSKLKDKCKCLE